MNRKYSNLLAGAFFALWSAACGAKTEGPSGLAEYGTAQAQLTEGWHLFSTATATGADFLRGVPSEMRVLFSVDHRYEAESGRVVSRYKPETSLVANRTYWVHVAKDSSVLSDGSLVPPSMPGQLSGEGYFVQPARAMRVHELGADKVFRWDSSEQQFVVLSMTESLSAGEAYWVESPPGCDAGAWGFQDAVRLLVDCKLEHSGLRIIPRSEWSTQTPLSSEPAGQAAAAEVGTKLILHHTATRQDERIQALEARRTVGQADLGFHFVVAQDESGEWQVYGGTRVDLSQPPAEINIAVMGTYEAVDAAVPETASGFVPDAPEAAQQPPAGAAVRLLSLVAHLSQKVPDIRGLYPYEPEAHADSPEASRGLGPQAQHLVLALDGRFFGAGRVAIDAAADLALSPWDYEARAPTTEPSETETAVQTEDPQDSTAPLLYLIAGSDVSVTARPRFRLDGVVYDDDLLEFSLNGVVLGGHNQSFSQELFLVPGRNLFELSAVDGAGNMTQVKKQVIYDDEAPRIEVWAPDALALLEKDTVILGGVVKDATLKTFTINEAPITLRGENFFLPVDVAALPLGLHEFELWAGDEAGLSTRRLVAFLVDEHGVKFVPELPDDDEVNTGDSEGGVAVERDRLGVHVDIQASLPGTDLVLVLTDKNSSTEEVMLSDLLEGGAGPRFKRASLFFEDLLNVDKEAIEGIDYNNVTPADSEVSLNFTFFGADDAPFSPSDQTFPALTLAHPDEAVIYTNVPMLRVDGQVLDENLSFVRVNEIITSTISGSFTSFVKLEEERTDLVVAARDLAGLEVQVRRTVLFDPKPPAISIEGGAEVTVYDANFVLRGRVTESQLVGLSLIYLGTGEETVVDVKDGAFEFSLSLIEGVNALKLVATDRAGNVSSETVRLTLKGAFTAVQAAEAPQGLFAWADGDTAQLRWRQPRLFADGTRLPPGLKPTYRVYRDETPIADEPEVFHQGRVPGVPSTYLYYVKSVLQGAEGVEYESAPSDPIDLDVGFEVPVVAQGELEGAASISDGLSLSTPEVVFSKLGPKVYAHLVYVVRSDEETPDEVRYARSEQFAKEGSFVFADEAIGVAPEGTMISDIALAAFGSQVVVGWIEQDESGSASRVVLKKSDQTGLDAGGRQAFRELRAYPKGEAWKRDLDMAFDHQGVHHMIWNEANKVYYYSNFQAEEGENGERLNVFDEQKRQVNHELVKYAHTAEIKCEDEAGECCVDRYTDTYTLAIDPEDSLACKNRGFCKSQFGVYLERTEETFVETPSLHVSRDSVTIVARQTRMFDNLPRANPAWKGLESHFLGPFVPPPRSKMCHGSLTWYKGDVKEYRKGFRAAELVDQYACALGVPSNVDVLVAQEKNYDKIQDFGKARGRYYAYDETQGHPANWFQYTHQGLWHEDDQIKVAQRPLRKGAWSNPQSETRLVPRLFEGRGARVEFDAVEVEVEQGFRQGVWRRASLQNPPPREPGGEHFHEEGTQFEETLLRWRIGTVERFSAERAGDYRACEGGSNTDRGEVGPSYAQVHAGTAGELYAVYERGAKRDPNDPEGNAIQFVSSPDGGLTWGAPKSIGQGYMPSLGVAKRGEIGVLYYAPDSAFVSESGTALGQIKLARSGDGEDFETSIVNEGFDAGRGEKLLYAAKPIHWRAYGSGADYYFGVPSLSTYEDLWVASFVKEADVSDDADQIMNNRISAPEARTTTVFAKGPAVATQNQAVETKLTCVDQYHALSQGCTIDAGSLAFGTSASSFVGEFVAAHGGTVDGNQTLWIPGFAGAGSAHTPTMGAALVSARDGGLSPALPAALREGVDAKIGVQPGIELFRGDAAGNYQRALSIRDRLFLPEISLQAEYEPDEEDRDSAFIAHYKRVWAYTQGIALAQFARQGDARAPGLARAICREDVAVWGTNDRGEQVVLGWHFSWNTNDDYWKDARLVTGANAWVIHGLGAFLSSKLSREDAGLGVRDEVQKCYAAALVGLADHRAGNLASNPQDRWLMTAGVTTRGLKYADSPEEIPLNLGDLGLGGGREGRRSLAYYDVLDVIGYQDLGPQESATIGTFIRDENDEPDEATQADLVLGLEQLGIFYALHERARAENVVTEHNLDTLSVLNHAIKHWNEVTDGLTDAEKRRLGQLDGVSGSEGVAGLIIWRNGLRDAIFNRLWESTEFELQQAQAALAFATPQSSNGAKKEREEKLLEHLLAHSDIGRVVTGGEFSAGHFHKSNFSAIDNCSWLSLSVDFETLPPAYQDKLASCLDYTIWRFTSTDLTYRGGSYYGAFYFTNSFVDRYVEQSLEQEDLYHIEATTGLIQGLLYFHEAMAETHPEVSLRYLQEATLLWADMQRFMAANGTPYATRSILDLMTQLSSATAAIWYLDVYDYFAKTHGDVNQPLKNYTHGPKKFTDEFPIAEQRAFVGSLWPTLENQALVVSETIELEDQDSPTLGISYLEDQAVAIVAAVNRGDAVAQTWIDAMLSGVVRFPETPGAPGLLPSAFRSDTGRAVAPYFQTGSQMLAAYSLLWYVRNTPASVHRNHVRAQAEALLKSLEGLHFDPQHGLFTAGLGDPEPLRRLAEGVVPNADEDLGPQDALGLSVSSVAALEDHVYAYFALRLAEEVSGDASYGALAAQVEVALNTVFWRGPAGAGSIDAYSAPVAYVNASEGSFSGDVRVRESASLYLLYATDNAQLGRAHRSLDLLALSPEVRASERSTGGPQAFSEDRGFGILAKRSARAFDPRQEEIAWNDHLDAAEFYSLSSGDVASLLIAENPRGFLGVHAASMFGTQQSAVASLLNVDERLRDVYVSTVVALLVSEPKPHMLDPLLRRLVAVDLVVEAMDDERPVQEWLGWHQETFRSRLMETIARLKNFCDARVPFRVTPIVGSLNPSRLGLDCSEVGPQFTKLLARRFGSDDLRHVSLLIERPNDAFELLTLVHLVHAPAYKLGSAETAFGAFRADVVKSTPLHSFSMILSQSSLTFAEDVTSKEVGSALSALWRETLRDGTLEREWRGRPLHYALDDIDFIQMANPSSPAYFSREAREHRVVQGLGSDVTYTLGGQPTVPVFYPGAALGSEPAPTQAEREENVRQLRRLINLEADGSLPLAAFKAGLSTDAMHRMMRTGLLTARDFHKLALGLGLSSTQSQSGADKFVFLGVDSAHWPMLSEGASVSAFDLLTDRVGLALALSVATPPLDGTGLVPSPDEESTTEGGTSVEDDELYQKTGGLLAFEGEVKDLLRAAEEPEDVICTSIRVKNHSPLAGGDRYRFSGHQVLGGKWLYMLHAPSSLEEIAPQEVGTVSACVKATDADALPKGVDAWYSLVNLELTNTRTGETVSATKAVKLRFEEVPTLVVPLAAGGVLKVGLQGCAAYKVQNTGDHPVKWHLTAQSSSRHQILVGLGVHPEDPKVLAAGAEDTLVVCAQATENAPSNLPAHQLLGVGDVALVNVTDGLTQSFKVFGYRKGLVAHWPLNRESVDLVSGNDGLNVGIYEAGHFGEALYPSVEAPGFMALEEDLAPGARIDSTLEPFMVMAWVKPNTDASGTSYFVSQLSNGTGWAAGLDAGGYPVFHMRDGSWQQTIRATQAIGIRMFPESDTDDWFHVTIGWDGEEARFFFTSDSAAYNESASLDVGSGIAFSPESFLIGGARLAGTKVEPFQGAVDDLKVYRGSVDDFDMFALANTSVSHQVTRPSGIVGIESCGSGRGGAVVIKEGYWSYEVLPNVVKNDGSEPFYVEVRTDPSLGILSDLGMVLGAHIEGPDRALPGSRVGFRDDGISPDHTQGDGIYVAGPLRYVGAAPTYFADDRNGPVGASRVTVGLKLGDPKVGSFVISPSVGLIDATIAERVAPTLKKTPNGQASNHFVNVCRNKSTIQSELRGLGFDPTHLANGFYEAGFSDTFQFMVGLSTHHVEKIGEEGINERGGYSRVVRDDTPGLDITADGVDVGRRYGSDASLEALAYVDVLGAGISSYRVTHELMHRFGAYWNGSVHVDGTDVLLTDTNHYLQSVGDLSLLKFVPYTFEDLGNGKVGVVCKTFRQATKVDEYLWGVRSASSAGSIPVLVPADGKPKAVQCNDEVLGRLVQVSVADDIVPRWGERPAAARTNYRIAFVGETLGRTMTPREVAFYEILAAHYTKALPEGDLPVLTDSNWVSIDRYFPSSIKFESALVKGSHLAALPTQIAFEQPEGLVGYWSFDGDLSEDQSFLRHAADVNGQKSPGVGGGALKGTLSVDSAALQFGSDDTFTVSLSVWPEPSARREAIIGNLGHRKDSVGPGWEMTRQGLDLTVRTVDVTGRSNAILTALLHEQAWNTIEWRVHGQKGTVDFELTVNGETQTTSLPRDSARDFKSVSPILVGDSPFRDSLTGVVDELKFYRGDKASQGLQTVAPENMVVQEITLHLDPDGASMASGEGVTAYRDRDGLTELVFTDGFVSGTVVKLPASDLSSDKLSELEPYEVSPFVVGHPGSSKFVDTVHAASAVEVPSWLQILGLAAPASAYDGEGATYVFLSGASVTDWTQDFLSGQARVVTLALDGVAQNAEPVGELKGVDDSNPLYLPIESYALPEGVHLPDSYFDENRNIEPFGDLEIEVTAGGPPQTGMFLLKHEPPDFFNLSSGADNKAPGGLQALLDLTYDRSPRDYMLEFSFPDTVPTVQLPEWISGFEQPVTVEVFGLATLGFVYDPNAFVGYEGQTLLAYANLKNVTGRNAKTPASELPPDKVFTRRVIVKVKGPRVFEVADKVVDYDLRTWDVPSGLYEVTVHGPDRLAHSGRQVAAAQRHVFVPTEGRVSIKMLFQGNLLRPGEDITISLKNVATKEIYNERVAIDVAPRASAYVGPSDENGEESVIDFETPDAPGWWGSSPYLVDPYLDWIDDSFAMVAEFSALNVDEASFGALWTTKNYPRIGAEPRVLAFDVKSATYPGLGAKVAAVFTEKGGERWRSEPLVLTADYQTMVLSVPHDFRPDGYAEKVDEAAWNDVFDPGEPEAFAFVFTSDDKDRNSVSFAVDNIAVYEGDPNQIAAALGGIRVLPPPKTEEELEAEIIEGPNVAFIDASERPETINPEGFNLLATTVTYLDILAGRVFVPVTYYGSYGKEFLLESAWGSLTPEAPNKYFQPGGQPNEIHLNPNTAILRNLRNEVAKLRGMTKDETTIVWEVLFFVDPLTGERVGQLPIKIDLSVVGSANIDGPAVDESLEPQLFFNDFQPVRGCTKDCDPTWGIWPDTDRVDYGADVVFRTIGDSRRLVYENPQLLKQGAVWLAFEEDLTLYEALSFRIQAPERADLRTAKNGCVHVRLVEADGDAWVSEAYNIPVTEDREITIPITEFAYSENDLTSATNRRPNFSSIGSISFNFVPDTDPGVSDHVVYSIDTLMGHPVLVDGRAPTEPDCETAHDDFEVVLASPDFRGLNPAGGDIKLLLDDSDTYEKLKPRVPALHWTNETPHWDPGNHAANRSSVHVHESFAETKAMTIAAVVHQVTHDNFHQVGNFVVPVPCPNARKSTVCPAIYNAPRIAKSERQWREFVFNLYLRAEAEAVLNSLLALKEIDQKNPGVLEDISLSHILPLKLEQGEAINNQIRSARGQAQKAFDAYWSSPRTDKEPVIRALLLVVQWRAEADGASLRGRFNERLLDLWGSGLEEPITEAENPFRRLTEVDPYMYTRDRGNGHYDRHDDPNDPLYDPRDQDAYWYGRVRPPFQGVIRVQYDDFLVELDEEDGMFRTCGHVKGSPVPCASAGSIAVDPRPRQEIFFSGYSFTAKKSEELIAPGPNLWSETFENVFVDDEGLHLRITPHPVQKDRWYSAEVIADKNLGYGQYIFTVQYNMLQKPQNVVFGLFLWDPRRDAAEANHREIDIEFSRWETSDRPAGQFAVPPYEEGMFHRFEPNRIRLERADYVTTYVMDWQSDRILFRGYYGAQPAGDHFVEWKYDQAYNIAAPGEETVRMNLWIVNQKGTSVEGKPAPLGGEPVEAIIKSFRHERRPLR